MAVSRRPSDHRYDRRSSIVLSPAARWARIADAARAAQTSSGEVRDALSLKTDPDPLLLATARDQQFLAEAITAHEAASACAAGFAQDELVLNGQPKAPANCSRS